MNDVVLGKTIHEIRELKEMTLLDVANKCGVSVPYLSLIENGKRRLSLDRLEKISKALDIPLSIILFLAYEKEIIKDMNIELYTALSSFVKNLVKEKTT